MNIYLSKGDAQMTREDCKNQHGWELINTYKQKKNLRVVEKCTHCQQEFDYNPSSCTILMEEGCNDLKVHVGIRIPDSVNTKVTALKNELGFTTRNAAFTYILSSFFKED